MPPWDDMSAQRHFGRPVVTAEEQVSEVRWQQGVGEACIVPVPVSSSRVICRNALTSGWRTHESALKGEEAPAIAANETQTQ